MADVLRLWPARRVEGEHGELKQGLPIRLRLQRSLASAEIELGDEARFWPCDEALVAGAASRAAAWQRLCMNEKRGVV